MLRESLSKPTGIGSITAIHLPGSFGMPWSPGSGPPRRPSKIDLLSAIGAPIFGGMADFYSARDVRELFGSPGFPISKTTLKKYRDEGVGPLPGDFVKTKLPYVRINATNYRYPIRRIDALVARLREWGKLKS